MVMFEKYHQEGLTYLALLFIVAVTSVILAATGALWSVQMQREREIELLFVGNQFRQAIREYYEKSPGLIKHYPVSFDELIRDSRYLGVKRYLRQIYADPVTRRSEWMLLIAPEGGIMGVCSLSDRAPIKQANFSLKDAMFKGKDMYSKWCFVYHPSLVSS
jgi:type II secretory pathway pseudopilin PulG